MKTTKTATATKKTATTNNKKVNTATNEILSLVDIDTMLINMKLFESGNIKKYTDQKFYIGIGRKYNCFSINVKKSKYNIYCSNDIYNMLSSEKYNDTVFTQNGNCTDHTRPNYIECKNNDDLKKMIKLVIA